MAASEKQSGHHLPVVRRVPVVASFFEFPFDLSLNKRAYIRRPAEGDMVNLADLLDLIHENDKTAAKKLRKKPTSSDSPHLRWTRSLLSFVSCLLVCPATPPSTPTTNIHPPIHPSIHPPQPTFPKKCVCVSASQVIAPSTRSQSPKNKQPAAAGHPPHTHAGGRELSKVNKRRTTKKKTNKNEMVI